MVSFGEKAKIKKAGNLNEGRSYVITTVLCIGPDGNHPHFQKNRFQFLFILILNDSIITENDSLLDNFAVLSNYFCHFTVCDTQ